MMGKGNFASVYTWERNSDGKQFAVKSMEKHKILKTKEKRGDNFLLQEIDIMRELDH